jgi:CTP:molybdopterin cytidylyltransferase MocA
VSAGYDVVVVAGDRHASRPVLDESKAFLPLAGAPLLHHVLAAVERARATARVFVVGDARRIRASLEARSGPPHGLRPLVVLEQRDTLYQNLWVGFRASLGDVPQSAALDKPILVVPGDTPLVTAEEIDEFADGCDLARYDYCIGAATEETLGAFYPTADRPGIAMTYFDFRQARLRQNNLHLVKPLRFGNREYVERVYELRYQRQWRNVMTVALELWQHRDATARTVWSFARLHIPRLAAGVGLRDTPLVRAAVLDLTEAEAVMSSLMRTRFNTVVTGYGGCALDIDDAAAYEAIRVNFTDWRAHLARLAADRDRATPG